MVKTYILYFICRYGMACCIFGWFLIYASHLFCFYLSGWYYVHDWFHFIWIRQEKYEFPFDLSHLCFSFHYFAKRWRDFVICLKKKAIRPYSSSSNSFLVFFKDSLTRLITAPFLFFFFGSGFSFVPLNFFCSFTAVATSSGVAF